MTTKVVKGSLWTLAGQVAPLAVSLVTTPISIRLLGAESYGVLILVGLLPTYFAFADLGMGLAATKNVSQAFSNSNLERENEVIWAAVFWGLLGSFPVALLFVLFSPETSKLLNIPPNLTTEASLSLKITSITFVITIVNTILSSTQLARLRMDIVTYLNTIPRVLGLAGTPIVLYYGFGIVGVTAVLLATASITLCGNLIVLRYFLRDFFRPCLNTNILRLMINFGIMVAVASVATAIIANVEKVVIPSLTSVEQLAYYSVAFTIAYMMTLFSVSMAQSLIPAFSQLQKQSDRVMLSSLYIRAIKFNLIWISPILMILAIFGDELIGLWAGPDFGSNGSTPFVVLLLGVGSHVIATPARAALMASGRSDIMAKVGWAEVVPYTLVVVGSTYMYGAVGAASAWSLRSIVDSILSFVIVSRISDLGLTSFFRLRYLVFFVCALPILSSFLFGSSNLFSILVLGSCLVLYGVLVWLYVLDKQEAGWLLKSFKKREFGLSRLKS